MGSKKGPGTEALQTFHTQGLVQRLWCPNVLLISTIISKSIQTVNHWNQSALTKTETFYTSVIYSSLPHFTDRGQKASNDVVTCVKTMPASLRTKLEIHCLWSSRRPGFAYTRVMSSFALCLTGLDSWAKARLGSHLLGFRTRPRELRCERCRGEATAKLLQRIWISTVTFRQQTFNISYAS